MEDDRAWQDALDDAARRLLDDALAAAPEIVRLCRYSWVHQWQVCFRQHGSLIQLGYVYCLYDGLHVGMLTHDCACGVRRPACGHPTIGYEEEDCWEQAARAWLQLLRPHAACLGADHEADC